MSGEEHTRAAATAPAVAGAATPSGGASNGDATKHDAGAPQAQKHASPPTQPADRVEEPKQARAPKLAPAPVPQQTPWKAPPIDASLKTPLDAVEVAQQKRSEQREASKPREGKRATTGKEKWVPYTPAPAPPSAQSGPTSSSGSQRGKPARRGANAPFRGQRRSDRGDKRQPRSHSGSPAPQAVAQKHHARSQSTASAAGAGADDASKLEKLSLEDSQRRGPSGQSHRGAAAGNSQGSTASNSPADSAQSSSANTPVPQHQRKRDNPRKMPYYQPGFVPMGYPMQMMRMPVPAVAPGVGAPGVDQATYMFNALVAQVDYYFSVENLCKDMFLRKQMNDQGLVPISTIGAFNRVKSMAPNTEVVAEACRWAPNIELVGSKVRVARGWQQWVMPQSERLAAGLDNTPEPAEEAPKFQVEQAKPFVPKSQ